MVNLFQLSQSKMFSLKSLWQAFKFFGNCCSKHCIQKLSSSTRPTVNWPLCKVLGTLGPRNLFQDSQCQSEERDVSIIILNYFYLGLPSSFKNRSRPPWVSLTSVHTWRWMASNLKGSNQRRKGVKTWRESTDMWWMYLVYPSQLLLALIIGYQFNLRIGK